MSHDPPSFRQTPIPGDRAQCLGSGVADRARRDRREQPRHGGRELDDGTPRRRHHVSHRDVCQQPDRSVVAERWAGAVLGSEGGGALDVDTLKNHRARTVPLVAELVPIVDRWSAGKEPEAWLFAAPDADRCVSRTGSGRSAGGRPGWQPVCRTCAFTICAALLHRCGWPLVRTTKVVQRVLGYATAAMTMDLYGDLVDASLWQAARLIGGTTGGI